MEKNFEKQSRFFYGEKKELLQLIYIFPSYKICNSYSEISSYYPCLLLSENFEGDVYANTIFFIVSSRRINCDFIHISKEKLKEILCDFFEITPPLESNEPFLSLIYKYSICKDDVRCLIPSQEESTFSSISDILNKINFSKRDVERFVWSHFIKKVRYSFLKTGNQTLANYIILVGKIFNESF